ncbi:hypothetical protein DXO89_13005 [Xanthomonas oryzae pv. oryzae]|nr:hypothetical protein BXO2_12800 [Xanthomonas oryzae pv. oryzae]OLG41833.1 hypothetical protein BXO33_18070 [Xanthomonas oryzae pv. oryzae]OLG44863.1 hypothetical protein BXO25_13005 [Xanthomonas oryzae pv. oryzae]OLG52895.1 hypothetical protein BXO34_15975 [Xanthomonas oryzae pv. oryzae]OLG60490.1 hypothetical protein BXO407_09340 [Xanthomonas oryzae pv. oryzae]
MLSKYQQSAMFGHALSLPMQRAMRSFGLRHSYRPHPGMLQSRQTQQVMAGNLQPDHPLRRCQTERA